LPALLTSVLLIAYLWFVGWALLLGLRATIRESDALLAPAVGVAAVVVPTVALNRLGLPVGSFALGLALVLGGGACVIVVARRKRASLAPMLAFLPLLGAALLLTAWPMFLYGFGWLSYANEDMANYALTATRLAEHGYYVAPGSENFRSNIDFPSFYWFEDVLGNERFGIDEFLAWSLSLMRQNAFHAFMPTIMALYVSMIAAASGLIYRTRSYRGAALLTCGLLACSSLASFGVEYQLIAQAGGIALMCAAIALLCRPLGDFWPMRASAIGELLLAAIVLAGCAEVYPEVSPFVFLTVLAWYALAIVHREVPIGRAVLWLSAVAGLAALILNGYLRNYTWVVVSRVLTSSAPPESVELHPLIFPFYLLPTGVANYFGIYPLTIYPREPWLSLGIAIGFVLLSALAVATVNGILKREPVALVNAIAFVMAGLLFFRVSDFGLYKLAMYSQPMMLGTLALWWYRLWSADRGAARSMNSRQRNVAIVAPVAVFVVLNLLSQGYYTQRSLALHTNQAPTFVEIPYASSSQVADRMQSLADGMPASAKVVVCETSNIVLAKLVGGFFTSVPMVFIAGNAWGRTGSYNPEPRALLRPLRDPDVEAVAKRLSASALSHIHSAAMPMLDRRGRLVDLDAFEWDDREDSAPPSNRWLLETGPTQAAFNHRSSEGFIDGFKFEPLTNVRNRLVFVDSEIGHSYAFGSFIASLFQLEPDFFYRNGTMAGVGRYMLVRIINPSPKVRLSIWVTTSLSSDRKSDLPDATVIGTTRVSFHLSGAGSARAVSEPVAPRYVDGRAYLLLDMGAEGRRFSRHPGNLGALYHRDIPIDYRKLVGFLRDLSAMDAEEYDSMHAPTGIFPSAEDFADPALFYSGFYEEGWLSKRATLTLESRPGQDHLHIGGYLPVMGGDQRFSTEAQVLVDGKAIFRRKLFISDFDFAPVAKVKPGKHQVVLTFDNVRHLPGDDGRPVTIFLNCIGFESGASTKAAGISNC
jgi:hypothetical protein